MICERVGIESQRLTFVNGGAESELGEKHEGGW